MKRAIAVFAVVHLFAAGTARADERQDISNWAAPPYWTPAAPETERDTNALEELAPSALPSGPMPFVAITPCRLADTRVGYGFTGSYGPPALVAGSPRSFPITGQCGIPPGAGAVSFNVTVTGTLGGGMILAYPTGGSAPTVSTLNYVFGQTVANAAVVPLSTGGAATFLAGSHGTQLLLDVNGYYAPVNLVNTLNALTGNVSLAQSTNVTIATTGNTLTFSSVPGVHTHAASDIVSGTLADARLGGTYSGALMLSNTANALKAVTLDLGTGGTVVRGGIPYVHSPTSTDVFVGLSAGDMATTTGLGENSALGYMALRSVGLGGGRNTAVGLGALSHVVGGTYNIGIGWDAGVNLVTGYQNIYIGSQGTEENTTIRIGEAGIHLQTILAGVVSQPVYAGATAVYIDASGKLGTFASSRRYKTDIGDIGDASDVLLKLRPVSFRYKPERGPSGEQQYGLIAEEVAEVAPDLVIFGKDGQPESVKYHLVNALLLDRVQKQETLIARQSGELDAQRAELDRLRSSVEELLRRMEANGR